MKIYLTSVYVDDQDKALTFYTEVLGFIKKSDFPVGQFKWLTVASPEEPGGVELLLEPNDNPAARQYQKALFEQGIAATSFAVVDIQKEYERVKNPIASRRRACVNKPCLTSLSLHYVRQVMLPTGAYSSL